MRFSVWSCAAVICCTFAGTAAALPCEKVQYPEGGVGYCIAYEYDTENTHYFLPLAIGVGGTFQEVSYGAFLFTAWGEAEWENRTGKTWYGLAGVSVWDGDNSVQAAGIIQQGQVTRYADERNFAVVAAWTEASTQVLSAGGGAILWHFSSGNGEQVVCTDSVRALFYASDQLIDETVMTACPVDIPFVFPTNLP